MFIGYARVSTHEQTLALQQDALTKADCARVFTDTASGAKADRPGLEEALDFARAGDTLVVWKLDRLGRSLPHLLETVAGLQERGIGFKSLTEQIDTTTSGGKLIFHIFAASGGIRARRHQRADPSWPRRSSRPWQQGWSPAGGGLSDAKKVALAQRLYDDTTNSIDDICKTLRVSRSTLYRYIKKQGAPSPNGNGSDPPTSPV